MNWETEVKIGIISLISLWIICINIAFIQDALALPANTTDWNWPKQVPELTDDDKEEDLEQEDEELHEEESDVWIEERER